MRAVLTRVDSASVKIGGEVKGSIGKGFLVLLGVHEDDEQAQALKIAIAAAGISESDLAAWEVQLDESGAQPVYRVTLTTVYYFHPRYVVAVDQMTGSVLSVEKVQH